MTDSQKLASKRYRQNHKSKQLYRVLRSNTKRFISKYAKQNDLKVINQLMSKRCQSNK